MSEFSIMLEEFIKEKDVQISELARYCGIDRKNLFRLLQGKENLPEEDIVQKMSLFMKLTPFEQNNFYEAYQISVVGRERFFMRKQVLDLIQHFPENFKPTVEGSIRELFPEKNETQGKNCFPLGSQTEVNQCLHRICLKEAQNGRNSKICMVMQADYEFIFDLLLSLKKYNNELEIEHVTCMDAPADIADDMEFYNLAYLKNILPLYINGMNYHLYSIKEDLQNCRKGIDGFSNLLLTSENALLCTSDFRKGIVYQSVEILEYFRERYYNYRSRGELRFHVIDNVQQQMAVLGNMGWERRISYALQPEPCLLSFLTPEIMEAAVYKELPDRERMLALASSFIENARTRVEKGINFFYCTKEALDQFVTDGRMPEIPSEIYRPLLPEERTKLIKEAVHLCEKGKFRFMKQPLEHLTANLHLCINKEEGYLLFQNIKGSNVYLIINDRKLLMAFWDFLSSMDDRFLYTGRETADYFRKVIKDLEAGL